MSASVPPPWRSLPPRHRTSTLVRAVEESVRRGLSVDVRMDGEAVERNRNRIAQICYRRNLRYRTEIYPTTDPQRVILRIFARRRE